MRSEGRDDRARALVLLAEQSRRQPANTARQGGGSRPVQTAAGNPASRGVVRVLVDAEGRRPELAWVLGAISRCLLVLRGRRGKWGRGVIQALSPDLPSGGALDGASDGVAVASGPALDRDDAGAVAAAVIADSQVWTVPAVVADAGERPPAGG